MLDLSKGKPIIVVGDVMLDRYIFGEVKRISPEAPVPVVNVNEEKVTLGGSANVAHNLANLAVNTFSFGAIGKDINGDSVIELMKLKKIKDYLYISNTIPTTTKTRIIGENQQIVRLDEERFFWEIDELLLFLETEIRKHLLDTLIISDYNKGVCSEVVCQYLINYAQQNNIKAIIDPKGKNWNKYSGAFLITPNIKELQDITGESIENDDDRVANIGVSLLKKYNLKNILITRSEKGMTLIEESLIVTHFHTQAQEVFDVSGAGDTVVSVLSALLNINLPLIESVELANKAAGVVVSKFGTYAINLEELNRLVI